MQLFIKAVHNVNSQNKISLYNIRSNNIPLFFPFQACLCPEMGMTGQIDVQNEKKHIC